MAALSEGMLEKLTAYFETIKSESCLSRKVTELKSVYNLLKDMNQSDLHSLFSTHQQLFHDFVHVLANSGMVNLATEIERDYERNDFVGVAETAQLSFSCLMIFLPCVKSFSCESSFLKSIFVPVLVLCAVHSQNYLWSSDICCNEAKNMLTCLLDIAKVKNIQTLLEGTETNESNQIFIGNLAKPVFTYLKPHLSRNTWEKDPSVRFAFQWFLQFIKHPHLVNYLADVLPPPLLFVDHFAVENKVIGLNCLEHIIENVPPTELKLNGRADVVYDALRHLMYTAEVPVLNALHPCMLKFLSGQERNPKIKTAYYKPNCYDEVYCHLLWSMEQQQKIDIRRTYSSFLHQYISAMGVTVVCHMKQTLRILLDYIVVYDGPEELSRINALHSLKILISVAWPRISPHFEEILNSILQCIYDTETRKNDILLEGVKSSILSEARDCLLYMKRVCPNEFEILLKEMPCDTTLPAITMIKSLENCD